EPRASERPSGAREEAEVAEVGAAERAVVSAQIAHHAQGAAERMRVGELPAVQARLPRVLVGVAERQIRRRGRCPRGLLRRRGERRGRRQEREDGRPRCEPRHYFWTLTSLAVT